MLLLFAIIVHEQVPKLQGNPYVNENPLLFIIIITILMIVIQFFFFIMNSSILIIKLLDYKDIFVL